MLSFTKKEQIVILLLASIIIIILGFKIIDNDDKIEIIKEKPLEVLEEVVTKDNVEDNPPEKTTIMVHISGEVNSPGIISLYEGDRVIDVVNKAGGSTSLADLNRVNLARKINDEEKIYIPKIGEEVNEEIINEVEIISSENKTNRKININNAILSELESLPGIGKVKASAIIKYREDNKFNNIEELTKVKGIGVKTLENIKEFITVN